MKKLIESIISCGRMLWDKNLVTACNGNISVRVDDERVLITATGTCLGLLREEDIVLLGSDGTVLHGGLPSSERRLHLDIYKSLSKARAVVHTHNPYTNAYYLQHDVFKPATYEAEYVLGEVFSVPQSGVNVTETEPVIRYLKESGLVVLKRHGTVAATESLFQCLAKIQTLEEQIKTEAIRRLFSQDQR